MSRVDPHSPIAQALSRRTLLVAGATGFCGLDAARLQAARGDQPAAASGQRPARSTILIWLSGGTSHIDTFDLKPKAAREFRGPFQPIATSAPGVEISEHLPMLAKQAHNFAIIRSLGHFRRGTGDHHAGYYYNLTGRAPDDSFRQLLNARTPRKTDWPFIGSVVGQQMPPHPYLPQAVSLPLKPGAPQYTRPGQFAANLGIIHDPVYVYGDLEKPLKFTAPALSLNGDITLDRLKNRRGLLETLDTATRRVDHSHATIDWSTHQQRAFSFLGSQATKDAFDIASEPQSVRDRYGDDLNAMSMLMARRLVEAGVPFVSVFWKGDKKAAEKLNCKSGGGWDTHGNNFVCLEKYLLPRFDRPFSALIEDLDDRGLLDQTLLMVNSEMGRKPKIGDPRSGGVTGQGRDHWTHAQSILLAGGGIRGGQAYGTSDKVGAYPADKPVAPEDVAKTVYHAMGLGNPEAIDSQGRPYRILEEGEPLTELF